nr:MAG TPA: hypothetical protein [Caudoviricetes sp.]
MKAASGTMRKAFTGPWTRRSWNRPRSASSFRAARRSPSIIFTAMTRCMVTRARRSRSSVSMN